MSTGINRILARLEAMEKTTSRQKLEQTRRDNFRRNVEKLRDKFIADTGRSEASFAAFTETTQTTIRRWIERGALNDRAGIVEHFCRSLGVDSASMWSSQYRERRSSDSDDDKDIKEAIDDLLETNPTPEKLQLLMGFISVLKKS